MNIARSFTVLLFLLAISVSGQYTPFSDRGVLTFSDGSSDGFASSDFGQYNDDRTPSRNSLDHLRDWNSGIGYVGFSVGGDFPLSSLETIENRLGVALSIGYGWKYIIFGVDYFHSNTTTANPVTIYQAGVEWSSDEVNYTGFAGTIGYTVYQGHLHLLEFNIGFGYNIIELVGPPTKDRVASYTYSTSFGLSYKYCLWGPVFMGSEIRYYINDFSNNTGTNLNGNSLALRLTFGIQGT